MAKVHTITELVAAADGVHVIFCPVCGERLFVEKYRRSLPREPLLVERDCDAIKYEASVEPRIMNTLHTRCGKCELWEEAVLLPVETERELLEEASAKEVAGMAKALHNPNCVTLRPACLCNHCANDIDCAVHCCVKHQHWCSEQYCPDFKLEGEP